MENFNKDDLINMVMFIKQKVGELSINERRDILQMIVNSGIDDNKIQTKGGGTQIKLKHIQHETVISIYNYISLKIKDKIEKLKNFTEEN
jgi:hypothetical protein